MSDLIRRQDAIEALEQRLEDDYLDGCELLKYIEDLPPAEPDNQVHLCGFCKYGYPECPAEMSDVIFGNGIGHDNVCACAKYVPSAEPERKWIPFEVALPNDRQKVLCLNKHNEMMVGGYMSDYGMTFPCYFEKPIAWMPLPEPYRGE